MVSQRLIIIEMLNLGMSGCGSTERKSGEGLWEWCVLMVSKISAHIYLQLPTRTRRQSEQILMEVGMEKLTVPNRYKKVHLKPVHGHQRKRSTGDARRTWQLESLFPHVIARTPRHSTCIYIIAWMLDKWLGLTHFRVVSMWIGEDEYQQLKLVLFKNKTICPPCMVHHCDFLCGCKNIATLFPTVLPAVLQD